MTNVENTNDIRRKAAEVRAEVCAEVSQESSASLFATTSQELVYVLAADDLQNVRSLALRLSHKSRPVRSTICQSMVQVTIEFRYFALALLLPAWRS